MVKVEKFQRKGRNVSSKNLWVFPSANSTQSNFQKSHGVKISKLFKMSLLIKLQFPYCIIFHTVVISLKYKLPIQKIYPIPMPT